MKRCFLFICFWGCLLQGLAQNDYYITSVKGKVLRADGSLIKAGVKVPESEKLTFTSQSDMLTLLHPKKGRIQLSPVSNKTSTGASIGTLVKDLLQLNEQYVKLGNGGGPPTNAPANIEVISMKGEVNLSKGDLVPGKKISENDVLIFTNPYAQLVLLHPKKGKVIISPSFGTRANAGKLSGPLKQMLLFNVRQETPANKADSTTQKEPTDSSKNQSEIKQ